jgi:hypothetical protein
MPTLFKITRRFATIFFKVRTLDVNRTGLRDLYKFAASRRQICVRAEVLHSPLQ